MDQNFRKAKSILLHDAKIQFGDSDFVYRNTENLIKYKISLSDIVAILNIKNKIDNVDSPINLSSIIFENQDDIDEIDCGMRINEHWELYDASLIEGYKCTIISLHAFVPNPTLIHINVIYQSKDVKYLESFTHSGSFTVEWEPVILDDFSL